MALFGHDSNSSDGEDFKAERINIPDTVPDDRYCGLANDADVHCCHKQRGTNTGRRFIACGNKEGNHCGFLEWKDKEWPDSMKRALIAIWNLYEKEKSARSVDKLQSAKDYDKLVTRKWKHQASMQEKLQNEVGKVQGELKTVVQKLGDAKHELIQLKSELHLKNLVMMTSSNMHKVLRVKAEKERDKLKDEKHDLEQQLAQLVTEEAVARGKVTKIIEYVA